jgi:hypothetical protein
MMEILEAECRKILTETKDSFIDLGEEDEPETAIDFQQNQQIVGSRQARLAQVPLALEKTNTKVGPLTNAWPIGSAAN